MWSNSIAVLDPYEATIESIRKEKEQMENKKKHNNSLVLAVKLLLWTGIYACVASMWGVVIFWVYKAAQVRMVDIAVLVLLSISLYINLRHYVKFEGEPS